MPNAKFYRANKERLSAERRVAYASNPALREKACRQKKAWYDANREHANATSKAYYEANRARLNEWTRQWYQDNKERISEARMTDRTEVRQLVIDAYGGCCNCPGCHVTHAELLTIDHVNGDGSEHRKTIQRGGWVIYKWLVHNHFPPEFQLLCGSCNLAKGIKDKCPLAGEDH